MGRKPKLRIFPAGVLLILCGIILTGCPDTQSQAGGSSEQGEVVADSWQSLLKTYSACYEDKALRNSILETIPSPEGAPVRYLQALLILDEGNPLPALELFGTIAIEDFPPEFLYVPFRLHAELKPDQPNPYWEPIYAAMNRGLLPQLIEARIHVMAGEHLQGLESYGDSDPAEWRDLDVDLFRQLDLHAGLQTEVRRLLLAALKARRVHEPIRADLVRILVPDSTLASDEQLVADLESRLRNDPDVARQVSEAAGVLVGMQQLFLEKSYRKILDQFGSLNPVEQADRVVILILLSAASENEDKLESQWSQELYRRYPTTEMKQWIESVRNPVASSP